MAELWVALAMVAMGPTTRAADWLPGYEGAGYRQRLSVTNVAHLTTALTNFPILVRLSPTNFNCLLSTPGGFDVRFTAEDGTTLLAFERESHGRSAQSWIYWVRLPIVHAGTNTDFYLYYSPWPTQDVANASNTWAETGYVVVQHLEESGGALLDSTGNAYNQAIYGDMLHGAAGLIDGAVASAGAGSLTAPALQPPYNGTYAFWIKPTFGSGALVRYMQAGQGYSYAIELNGDNTVRTVTHDGNNIDILDTTATAPNGQWTHVVTSFGSGQLIYLNGSLAASNGSGRGARFANENATFSFSGAADEFRVSTVRFSAEWIQTTYLSECDALLAHGIVEGAAPQGLPGYVGRLQLSVTNHLHLGADLAQVPVMVKLSAANFDFRLAREDGRDIRFTWANGVTPLPFEREQHSAAVTQAVYWVQLPAIYAGTTTDFYLYFGNPEAVDASNASNTWSGTGYVMVQHLEESVGTLFDSTSQTNHAENAGGVQQGVPGLIGGGVRGDGGSLRLPVLPYSFAFSFWIKPTTNSGYLAYGDIPGVNHVYHIQLLADGRVEAFVHDGDHFETLTSVGTVPLNQWTHVIDAYHPGNQRYLYLNGTLDAQTGGAQGIWYGQGATARSMLNGYQGLVDEIRLTSGVVLSEDWIKTQYLSELDALLQYGEIGPRGFMLMVK